MNQTVPRERTRLSRVARRTGAALSVLLTAACLQAEAVASSLVRNPGTFARHFEDADFIIWATIDEASSGQIEELTIQEVLKGEGAADLLIEFFPRPPCCGSGYAAGEEWVLFLTRVSKIDRESPHRISPGSFRLSPIEAESADRTRARLAALRGARDEELSLLEVRWSVRTVPASSLCILEKPLHGTKAAGRIEFIAGPSGLRLHVDYRLRDSFDANGSPDQKLTLDIGGVPHQISPDGAWGATPGAFVAHGNHARYTLDSLTSVRQGRVRAHLSGDFEALVGMDGFVDAFHWFRRLRRTGCQGVWAGHLSTFATPPWRGQPAQSPRQ